MSAGFSLSSSQSCSDGRVSCAMVRPYTACLSPEALHFCTESLIDVYRTQCVMHQCEAGGATVHHVFRMSSLSVLEERGK